MNPTTQAAELVTLCFTGTAHAPTLYRLEPFKA
jgi:hypothetical protein